MAVLIRSGEPSPADFMAEISIRPITDAEFALFQALIYREAGIYLSEAKKALLVGRLTKRLKALGLTTFKEYYGRVVDENDEAERVRLFDSICTNETHFFREPHQFAFLENHIIPEFSAQAAAGLRPRRIRVWSAACSTGEEPYSIAMVLMHHLPPSSGWGIEVLATDLSTRALRVAEGGVWPLEKRSEIPIRYLKSSMLRDTRSQEGRMKASPEVQAVIQFYRINLNHASYSVAGSFDLIFCRNVLIYFDADSRARVVSRLLNQLEPGGYFFVGHAESLNGVTDLVRNVVPTVYAFR